MIDLMESSAATPAGSADTVRVLLVDDHAVVVEGIASLLDAEPDIAVVARAGDVAGAVTAATHHEPDVVLMDFRLPDGTGADAIDRLREAGCDAPVVMLTAATDRRALRLSLEAGCVGFLSKNADQADLVRAVHAAARDETAFSDDMLTHLVHVTRVQPGADGELTPRECDVLQLSAEGSSPEEIATRLHLSPHTVRNHLRHAMEKLGAHTKLDAVLKAVRAHLISVEG